ncbi:SLC13 family permease [Nocardia sp. NPDC051750]|uniref:SLC13 family permease n=1 Tax=Nocardia sp. NPDC051750 TaxID=3364325 RepID=UPI0037962956
MSVAGLSLFVLAAIFIIGTVWPVSIGVAAFASVFLVGILAAGIPTETLIGLFPADLFILLVGITYLFAVAQQNGTMAFITETTVRLVRGRAAVIPWIFHFIAILFSALGAGPAAATVVLAPLALGIARQARISLLLMGIMVIHGSHAGSMSPIGPIGAFVNSAAANAGIPVPSGTVLMNSLLFNVALALAAYLLFGGIGLLRRGRDEVVAVDTGSATAREDKAGQEQIATAVQPTPADSVSEEKPALAGAAVTVLAPPAEDGRARATPRRIATLAGIGLLVVLGIGFGLNIGFSAFAIGLVLTLMSPKDDTKAIAAMPWSTILMLGGIITYIGLVGEVGGIGLISDALLGTGSPLLAILLIALVGAITSLMSATGAVIGVLIPMLGAVLGAHPAVPAAGAVSALAISSSVVDSSPLSMQGAVLIANVEEQQRTAFFRRLLAWGASMVVIGTVVPVFIFVLVPMWFG